MTTNVPNTAALYSFYSLPHLTASWLIGPIAIIQGIYAKYYGLSLSTIALVILFARMFDALSDPAIGFFSDLHYSRTGTRKPFIVVGGLLFILSSYFLFVPLGAETPKISADVSIMPDSVSAIYFTFWFVLFYLSWTLFEIPHTAWGGELACTSADKTKVYTFREVAAYLGKMSFYVIPLLPFFESSEITPYTLKVATITAGILMLPFLYLCMTVTPKGAPAQHPHNHVNSASVMKQKKGSLHQNFLSARSLVRSMIGNKPFLIFLGAFLFAGIGIGMWGSLIFIYVDAYLGLGKQFAKMFLISFVVSIIATPVWYKLIMLLGKKIAWLLAMGLIILSFGYTGTLNVGEVSFIKLTALIVIQTLGFTCMGITAPALLSEIADYGVLKYGEVRTATYFSMLAFMVKSNAALGAALGLGLAGWFGFDATATEHSDSSIFGLRLAIAWLPPVLVVISLVFIALTPINAHRFAIIRRRLDARVARTAGTLRPHITRGPTQRRESGLLINSEKAPT